MSRQSANAASESAEQEQWKEMEERFRDLADLIQSTRLEGREEAIDETSPEWHDPGIGAPVRAWNLIPYRAMVDRELLEWSIEAAKEMMAPLERMFAARELTLEFLETWGRFCEAASFLRAVYLTEGDDLAIKRGTRRGNLTKQSEAEKRKRWFAEQLVSFMEKGRTRQQAEGDVEADIRRRIRDGVPPPPDCPADWYAGFLKQDGRALRPTYTVKNFSMQDIETLVMSGTQGAEG